MELEELKESVDKNTKALAIIVDKVNENAKGVQQNSGALEILKDFKGDNKRLFVILIIVLFMWFTTICYLVYVLNDIRTIDETKIQELYDFESIEQSDIINGDYYGED